MDDHNVDTEIEPSERDVHSVGGSGADGRPVAKFVPVELVLTMEKAEWLWNKIVEFPQAWDDYFVNNRASFAAALADRNSVFVELWQEGASEPSGLVSASRVMPGHMAEVHCVFWDRTFRGRESCVRHLLRTFVVQFGLQRVAAFVPETNRPACKFALRIGMRHEGTLRRAAKCQGQFVDLLAFSMTREEALQDEQLH